MNFFFSDKLSNNLNKLIKIICFILLFIALTIFVLTIFWLFLWIVMGVFFHLIINLIFGPGSYEMYAFIIKITISRYCDWFLLYAYIYFISLSPFFLSGLILFLPLAVFFINFFFGAYLGQKYSGLLASLGIFVSALSAGTLWIAYDFIAVKLGKYFCEWHKFYGEYYEFVYNRVAEVEKMLSLDAEAAKAWLTTCRPDSAQVAYEQAWAQMEVSYGFVNYMKMHADYYYFIKHFDPHFVFNFGNVINFDGLCIDWSFKFDLLALSFCFVILSISFLVHLYACDYLSNDQNKARFFSYLSLFTFFMLMLVTSSNMFVFYIAWEGVGICSFLLISFWSTRAQAVKAGFKALLVNKTGDVCLLSAACLIYFITGSIDFEIFFSSLPVLGLEVAAAGLTKLDVVCFLLMVAAFVKSAQLFFHVWLADAMEGPTPVSALLHAATMVTAGVFLIIRFSYIFEYSPLVLELVVYFSVLTIIISGLIGLFQYDIKKIIAYSTCSQLGFMFLACGLSGYTLAVFHFINHAFFKALLFLSAGVLIHALGNEQDIRKMGGLRHIFPFTYTCFIIGSLSLCGFPFFSGFFSKDAIVLLAYTKLVALPNNEPRYFLFWMILSSLVITCLYSFKIIFYCFLGNSTNINKHLHVGGGVKEELNFFTTTPLFVLTLLSVIGGATFKDYFIGTGACNFLDNSVLILNEHVIYFSFFTTPRFLVLGILIFSYILCIIYCYYADVINKKITLLWKTGFTGKLFIFFNKKFFFDDLFNMFVSSIYRGAYSAFSLVDKGILELFGPTGLHDYLKGFSHYMKKKFNNGSLSSFIMFFLLGVVVSLFIIFFCFL